MRLRSSETLTGSPDEPLRGQAGPVRPLMIAAAIALPACNAFQCRRDLNFYEARDAPCLLVHKSRGQGTFSVLLGLGPTPSITSHYG